MISALFRLPRFRRIFRRPASRRGNQAWGGLGGAIRIEALDRGDSWTSCQLEQLEQRKVLDADFNLTGSILTITLDTDNQIVSFVSLSSDGAYQFELSGATSNNFNGTDGGGITGAGTSTLSVSNVATVTKLVVNQSAGLNSTELQFLDAGANEALLDVSVSLNIGDSTVTQSGNLTLAGGLNIANVQSITLNGTVTTGDEQIYGVDVTLLGDSAAVASGVVPDPSNMTIEASISQGGSNYAYGAAITSDSQYAIYSGRDFGIYIADVSNLAAPSNVSSLAFDPTNSEYSVILTSDDNYAFVGNENGVAIVNVSNPASPSFVSNLSVGFTDGGMALLNDQLLVSAAGGRGFYVSDVSNINSPSVLGNYTTSASARGVAISANGQYAYIAEATNGLAIYDISNPASISPVGSNDTIGNARSVVLSLDGQYAFLADRRTGSQTDSYVRVFDVSAPAAPVEVASVLFPSLLNSVAISGDGQYVYAIGSVLMSIDVTDPTNPQTLGTVAGSFSDANARVTSLSPDGYSAVIGSDAGLSTVSIGQMPGGGSNITFSGAIDGGFGLTVTTTETTTFSGAVGSGTPLASFATLGGGTTVLSSDVTTTGNQTFDDFIVLAATSTLTGNVGTISLGIEGATHDLTLDFVGTVTLDGGSTVSNVGDLVVANASALNVTISTIGDQTYSGGITLLGATTLSGVNASLAGGIDGQGNDLSLNFSGVASLGPAAINNLGSLTTAGDTSINGSITSTGDQNYSANTSLSGNATLISGAGEIVINDLSGAGYTLTVGDASQTGNVGLLGNVALGGLTSGNGSFSLALLGSDNQFSGAGLFRNNGTLTLADAVTDRSYFAGGVDALGVAKTNIAGFVVSNGTAVMLNGTYLTGNTTIDTTDGGNSATVGSVAFSGSLSLNGFELTTIGGTGNTEIVGNTTVSNGSLVVQSGDLDIGNPALPGTLLATENTSITVAAGGILNVYNGSGINVGTNVLSLTTDSLNVATGAGNITAGEITLAPVTASLPIFLGTATGAGLAVGQTAFDAFKTATLIVGNAGYNGTVAIGDLTVGDGRLDIIANGTGGQVRLDGDLNLTSTSDPQGVGLAVYGSGATFVLNGSITSANAVVIDDAVQVDNGSHAINTAATGANITITGGNAGIYATLGQTNGLTIDAGTGAVILGNQSAFGDDGGNGSLVANLTIDAGTTSFGCLSQQLGGLTLRSGSLELAANITATGDIFFTASTVTNLTGASVVINSTGGDAALVGSINGSTALDVRGANITLGLGGTIAVDGLVANATADMIVAGTVTVDGDATFDAGGIITLANSTVTTNGNQSYQAKVELFGNTTLTAADQSVFTPNYSAISSVGSNTTPGFGYGSVLSADGKYAYLADSAAGLQILDISVAASPTIVGSYDTSGSARGVALSSDGGHVFVADSLDGLQIINVSDPTNPTLTGNLDTSGTARAVALSPDGKYAYVADGSSGLQVINVTMLSNPTPAGNYDTPGNAQGVAVSADGAYAFVADGAVGGLQVINITDAASPTLEGNVSTAFDMQAVVLDSTGQYAYVAQGYYGLQVVNVADVSSPSLEDSISGYGGTRNVALSSDDDYAFLATGYYGLVVVNVADVTALATVSLNPTLSGPYGVTLAASGEYAYVAIGSGGFEVFQLGSTQAVPSTVAFADTVNGNFALTVNATSSFAGAVGGATPLASLTADGDTSLGANVTTAGDQTYSGNAVLTGNATLEAGGDLTFGGAIDSAAATSHDLTVNISGSASLGSVGESQALGSLNVINASAVTFAGIGGAANGVVGDVTVANVSGLVTFGASGNANYAIGGDLTATSGQIEVAANAAVATGGNIALTGTGGSGTGPGVAISVVDGGNTSLAVTGSSTITLTGTGGATSSSTNEGVALGASASTGRLLLESEAGNITIFGEATGTTEISGVQIWGTTIETLQGGSVNITGAGSSTAVSGDFDGVTIENDSSVVINTSTVATGGIVINGTATAGGEGIDVVAGGNSLRAGSGGVTLIGTNDGGNSDGISFDGVVDSIGGPIVFNGTGGGTDGEGIITGPSTIGSANTTEVTLIGTASPAGSGDEDGIQLVDTTVTASGNISLTGIAADTGEAVELDNTVVAAGGSIVLNGTGDAASGIDLNTDSNLTADGSVTILGRSTSGLSIALLDTVVINGTTGVSLVGDQIELVDTATTLTGGGALVIEPEGASFTAPFSTEDATIGSAFTSARLGKVGNTGNVTVGTTGLNIAGPIEVYGGTTTVSGELNSTAAGADITVVGSTAIDLGANLTTANGSVQLDGSTSLSADATIATGAGAGNVTFNGTLDGGSNLSLTAGTGAVTFAGAVGNTAALASLEIDAGGTTKLYGPVTTTGNQTYGDAVVLAGDVTLDAGTSTINLASTVDSTKASTNGLTLLSETVFGGDVGSAVAIGDFVLSPATNDANLPVNVTAATITVTTSGNDTDVVADSAPSTVLNAVVGDVTLSSPGDISIGHVIAAGNVTAVSQNFDVAVGVGQGSGSIVAGGSVNLSAGPASVFLTETTVTANGSIAVNSAREYVEIDGNVTLNSAAANGTIDLGLVFWRELPRQYSFADLTLAAGSGDITSSGFGSTNGYELRNVTVTSAGNLTLLSGNTPLPEPRLSAANRFVLSNITGTATLGTMVVGTNLADPTLLVAAGDIVLNGPITTGTLTSPAVIGFNATAGNVTLTANGSLDINGSLAVDATGIASLRGDIATTGNQAYNAPITLVGDTTLTGNALTRSGVIIGGGNDLTLNFAATTALDSCVTGVGNLTSLGDTTLSGNITTSGGQAYSGNVTLLSPATLTGTVGSFSGGIAGGGNDLSLNFASPTVLSGVTNVANLFSSGPVLLGGELSTTGYQIYASNITLTADTTIKASSAGFALGVTGDGRSLTLDVACVTSINSNFTGIANLTSLGAVNLEGTITTTGEQNFASSVFLSGNTTLIAGTTSPDPSNLTPVGNLAMGQSASDVAASADGLIAYVADDTDGLRIVSVADPTAPSFLGNATVSDAYKLALSSDGRYAFVADELSGLEIFDVLNPASPSLVGNVSLPGSDSIALSPDNTVAYIGVGATGMFHVVDISDVANPVLSGNVAVHNPKGIATSPSGAYAYVADGYYGLQIVNVLNPASPTLSSNLPLVNTAYGLTLSADGGYAFVADYGGGLQIVDVSDPANLQIVGSWTGDYAYSVGLSIDGTIAYVGVDNGLAAIDVTDVTAPVFGAYANLPENAKAVAPALQDRYVYVADSGAGLYIVEVGTRTIGQNITFGGIVNGPFALTAQTTATVLFSDVVGGFLNLASVTTSAGSTTVIGGGSITTTGNQTYGGVVNLTADAELIGDTGSFAAGVEGGGNSLTLNFTSETAIGNGFANLTNLTSIGDVATNGTITTTNNQTYLANVTLAGDTTLTGNDVTFTSGVIGAGNDLTLNFAQTTAIDSGINGVGNLTSLGNVTLAGTVATIGAQDYQADATLTAATTIQGTTANFSGGVTGNGQDLTLNLSGGAVIDSQIAGVANLTAVSDVSINGTVTTTGSQSYQAGATLIGDSTLTGTQGTFAQGVTGANSSLTLNFTGTTAINGNFTGIANLTSLGDVTLEGNITTAGDQRYLSDANLAGDATLVARAESFVLNYAAPFFNGNLPTAGVARGIALSTDGQTAFVADTVGLQTIDLTLPTSPSPIGNFTTAGTAYGVELTPDGATAFIADGTAGLQILNVTNPAQITSIGSVNTSAIARSVTLSTDLQTAYLASARIDITNPGVLQIIDISSTSSPTLIGSQLLTGGAYDVALSADGQFAFVAASTAGLQIIDISDPGNLSIVSNVAVSNAEAVVLSGDGVHLFVGSYSGSTGVVALNVSDPTGPIEVGNLAVPAARLTLSEDEQYLFAASGTNDDQQRIIDVSNIADMQLVSTTPTPDYNYGAAVPANGRYAFLAGSYDGLLVLQLGNLVQVPGSIEFAGVVEGGYSLTADALDVTFGGTVGNSVALASLTTTANTTAIIAGGTIETTGNQTYGGVVSLSADAELIGNAGSFAAGVEGNTNSLTLNFTNETTLVGDFANLTNLTSIGDVATNGTISTINDQTYQAGFRLAGNTTLTGNAATLAESIDGGGNALDLNFTNATTLEGATNLASLTSVGEVALRGLLETTGSQTYDGGLQLVGDVSLVGNAASFASGVDGGGNSLTLNFSEPTQINGNFTGIDDLTVVGQADVDGTIATTGNQTYQSAIYLIDNATLTSGAGAISAAAVADGGEGNSLTLGDANQTGSVTLGGNLSFGTLSSGAGAFAVTLSGANNTLSSVSLLNTGNVSVGTSAASRTFATNGFTAPAAATSLLAGNITTDSGPITLNATSLTANAVLDSTNGGASSGAAITLANGTLLNGFTLTTEGGTSDTEITGNTTISDGELVVESGSLNLGSSTQPGSLVATKATLIQVANGAFNVFNGSSIAAGNNALTIETNSLQVASGAGNITAGSLTLLPATNGTDIFLGTATGTGLEISQNAFNAFRSPLITIGEAGYDGTVDVGTLTVPDGRLDIIANGTGGTVLFQGDFNSTATGVPGGIGLFVEGSGATTTINGTIASVGAVVINDAVVTDGSHTIDTSGSDANITITGGTAGIYGAAGQTNSLALNAGNGTVTLGSQTGFGDNSGTGALLEDVTISAGATLLGSTSSEINGTFNLLSGTLSLSANLTAGAINVASVAGTALAGSPLVTTNTGGVSFAGAVDGAANLRINSATATTFGGDVGGITPLSSLVIAENGSVTNLGGNVTTNGFQVFDTPVTLTANATLSGSTGVIKSINGSGYSLVLDYLCGTSLGNGGVAAENLASLLVQNGMTTINGSVATTASQTFANGSVVLSGPSTLQGSSVVFGKNLVGNFHDLTLNFSETTAVNGASFGTLGNLTSLGPVALSGTLDSAGFQNYAAAATLAADTTLNASGDIDFGSLVDGARQLNVQSGGNVNLFAALGSTTPLQGLNLASAAAVTALGTLAIDGTGGTGAGLRIGDGVNNVNIAQPGSTITAATTSGILLAGDTTGSTIGGFTITKSGSHGIEAAGGSYTGTTVENSSVTASAGDGFHAANATGLTGTLLHSAGNAKAGIRVAGTSNSVTISDSTVGLAASGTTAQPNLGQGVVVATATDTTLSNNTISGNGFYGVVVTGAAVGTTVMNNRIGVGTDGTTAIGNGQSGIFVLAGADGTAIFGNRISNNNGMAGIQVVDGTSNTTIGGSGPSANLLVGNGLFGITVSGDVPGTMVQGNLVSSHTTANIYLNNARNLTVGMVGSANTFDTADYGVYAGGDLTGTTIAGNTFQQHTLGGVVLTEAGNLTVRDNTLDDNGAYGIYGTGDLTGTTLQGNTISNHTVGVLVDNGANLTIGSANGTTTSDPDANVITKNTSAGVVVNGAGSQNVSILSNSIFENDFIGISLSAGGNALARTPTLATATTTDVTGSITGTDGDVFRIQYFKSADEVTSSSRFAQGQELIGYQDVTIVGGTASINEDISGAGVIVTDWITATATLLVGGLPSETSQFSFGIRVTA